MSVREIGRDGWTLIAASVVGVAVSVIPVAVVSFSVFVKPMATIQGWGRGEFSLALAIMSLAMAGALPFAGGLVDRWGLRRPLVISLILLGSAIAAVPTMIESHGLPGFYIAAAFVGIVGAPSSSVTYVKALSGWFDRNRGLALGFAMSGIALGGAIAPQIAVAAMGAADWKAGFYALAALPILIGLPISLLIREAPAIARTPGVTAVAPGLTLAEAVRTRTFALMIAVFLLVATAVHGIQLHMNSLMLDRGLSPQLAVTALSFMFIVSIFARLASGYLFDRVHAPWVGAASFFGSGVAALMLASAMPSTAGTIFAVALIGFGAGAEADLMAFLVGRYFGLRAFGQIFGCVFSAFMVGSAVGPFLMGVAFDRYGSYDLALYTAAAALSVTVVLLLLLPRRTVGITAPAIPAATLQT